MYCTQKKKPVLCLNVGIKFIFTPRCSQLVFSGIEAVLRIKTNFGFSTVKGSILQIFRETSSFFLLFIK